MLKAGYKFVCLPKGRQGRRRGDPSDQGDEYLRHGEVDQNLHNTHYIGMIPKLSSSGEDL